MTAVFSDVKDEGTEEEEEPQPTVTLTVDPPTGGTVVSEPDDIDCPDACAAEVAEGEPVTLTAQEGEGFLFTGWGGACARQDGPCTLDMAGDRQVSASFGEADTISVEVDGPGLVQSEPPGIECPAAECEARFLASETTVTLTATGETFDGWSSPCAREIQRPTVVRANRHGLDVLFLERSMRTLPEWHFRNRAKARWLRRSWVLLTVGMVFIAIAAVFVLARILTVTAPKADGPASHLTWAWLVAMIGGAALLAWAAIRFDWLRAGRDNQLKYVVPPDIAEIAERLSDSPVREERQAENGVARAPGRKTSAGKPPGAADAKRSASRRSSKRV